MIPTVQYGTPFVDYVVPSSPYLLTALNIAPGFLTKPVTEWNDDRDYIDGKTKINHLMVVNDLVERGVKLASDYLNTAKLENPFKLISDP